MYSEATVISQWSLELHHAPAQPRGIPSCSSQRWADAGSKFPPGFSTNRTKPAGVTYNFDKSQIWTLHPELMSGLIQILPPRQMNIVKGTDVLFLGRRLWNQWEDSSKLQTNQQLQPASAPVAWSS